MIKLNLITKCQEHELIKTYLEENVSESLAEKINNGVRIEKNGKTLISKKNLDSFMSYAQNEARKVAEKGKQYACIHHSVVFGWAIHYFEEDSIEGTLYNEDGTEYKPAPVIKPSTYTPKPVTVVKKKPENQFSLFDLIEEQKPTVEATSDSEDNSEEPTEEEIQEAMQIVEEETQPKCSPIYQRYIELEEKYPNYIVVYRLGDFYEIFGDNAKQIADKLDLTLTGRDCGLKERIPMIGFPYHCADNYVNKILEFSSVVIFENNEETVKEKNITNVDYETGEVFDLTEEEMREFDGDIYEPTVEEDDDDLLKTTKSLDKDILYKLYDILGNDFTIE